MMDALVWIMVWLNAAANLLGSVLTPFSGCRVGSSRRSSRWRAA